MLAPQSGAGLRQVDAGQLRGRLQSLQDDIEGERRRGLEAQQALSAAQGRIERDAALASERELAMSFPGETGEVLNLRELEQLVSELGFIGIGQQSGAIGNQTKLTRIPRFPAAGQYADLQDLAQKLRTLAFNITHYHDVDPVLSSNPPQLKLSLKVEDFNRSQLQCFAVGPTGVTVDAAQPHRFIFDHFIEQLFAGKLLAWP